MTARRCTDGLVHFVKLFEHLHDRSGWVLLCGFHDAGVLPTTLALPIASVTCVACVAKDFARAPIVIMTW